LGVRKVTLSSQWRLDIQEAMLGGEAILFGQPCDDVSRKKKMT
jgi:hypothetical protein